MSDIGNFNNVPHALEQLTEIQYHTLFIGALKQVGDRSIETMQMIVGVNETGTTIHPVNGRYLTIPTPRAGKRKARDINGLFFYMTKTGKPTLAKQEDGKLVVYFLLATEVRIPARAFLSTTMRRIKLQINRMVKAWVSHLFTGHGTWRELLSALGAYIAREIKKTIAEKSTPPNAPITAANKGFNNPLVDTGAMQWSMDWTVV